MKKLCSALLIMLFIFPAFSQEREHRDRKGQRERVQQRRTHFKNLNAEQIATLQTKKMAIALDLDENQKRELLKLNTRLASERKEKAETLKAKREKGEKLTEEERYKMANERLDKQYETLQEMKKILNEEQYEKWKKRHGKRNFVRKKQNHHRKRQRN
ncbi:hypothetical protein GTQ40_11325 [Flavobacteriaceae bacterium R38]|nr:hypothetical protein [Flavobacteriaceae bacterium R38]